MPHSRTHLLAVVAFLSAMSCGTAVAGETASAPQKVEHALERAADATGRGLKRGVEATSHGVQVAVKATGHGLSRAGEAVEHGTHKAADKVKSTFEK
jgi:hypothetical protein